MSGSIFFETLRRSWRSALYWGIGLAIYGFYVSVFIPDVKALKQYAELLKSMPTAFLKMFGAQDAAALATPEGFLGFVYFGYLVLIFAVYAIIAGLNITANEEDAGILDMVLSLPLARARIIVERFAAYTLFVVLIAAVALVGLVAGNQPSALKLDAMKLVQSSLNVIPSTLLVMAFTACAAVVIRRKGRATALAAVFVIGSYFINILGESAAGSAADAIRAISFFRYYDSSGVMQNGLAWGNIVLLVALAAVLVAGSLWFFQRRDVGV